MASKRKHAALEPEDVEPIDPADELMFLCLGGGNEVGRSCHILQYKGKTVMVRASTNIHHSQMLTDSARRWHASCIRRPVRHAVLR